MSREVRRMRLDFDWPLNTVWEGYLLPEDLQALPCPLKGTDCVNGVTRARAWVQELTMLMLMLDDDLREQLRGRPMHPYFGTIPGFPRGQYSNTLEDARPSEDISEFGSGLAGREGGMLGHDAIDRFRAEAKIIKAAGLKKKWGHCPECNGRAYVEKYPGQTAEAEAWTPTQPPKGAGWQMWETVSEGSPISPVFATPSELASWMLEHPHLNARLSYEQALKFVTEESSSLGSFVVVDGQLVDGTTAGVGD